MFWGVFFWVFNRKKIPNKIHHHKKNTPHLEEGPAYKLHKVHQKQGAVVKRGWLLY
jgi:hypothetical protein